MDDAIENLKTIMKLASHLFDLGKMRRKSDMDDPPFITWTTDVGLILSFLTLSQLTI